MIYPMIERERERERERVLALYLVVANADVVNGSIFVRDQNVCDHTTIINYTDGHIATVSESIPVNKQRNYIINISPVFFEYQHSPTKPNGLKIQNQPL